MSVKIKINLYTLKKKKKQDLLNEDLATFVRARLLCPSPQL